MDNLIANNDRDMLLYLMQAFDNEAWNCPRCGHGEDTKTMDSAMFLREYLAVYGTQLSSMPPSADQFKAEREKAVQECIEIILCEENDAGELYANKAIHRFKALLSTDESKE